MSDQFFMQAYWLVNRHKLGGFYQQNKQDLVDHWQIIGHQLAQKTTSFASMGAGYRWGFGRYVYTGLDIKDLGEFTKLDFDNDGVCDASYQRLECFCETMHTIDITQRAYLFNVRDFGSETEKQAIKAFWQPTQRFWDTPKQLFHPSDCPVTPVNTTGIMQDLLVNPREHKQLLSLGLG